MIPDSKVFYKLTDKDGRTKAAYTNALQWGVGISHAATGKAGQPLCSDGYIHCYDHPLVGVLRNCQDGKYGPGARMWECWGEGEFLAEDLKCGFRRLTILREIPLPVVTPQQAVRWGILCSLEVYHEKSYVRWATWWLDGTERSADVSNIVRNNAYIISTYGDCSTTTSAYAAYAAAAAAYAAAAPSAFPSSDAYVSVYVASSSVFHAAKCAIDFGALAEQAVAEETCDAL